MKSTKQKNNKKWYWCEKNDKEVHRNKYVKVCSIKACPYINKINSIYRLHDLIIEASIKNCLSCDNCLMFEKQISDLENENKGLKKDIKKFCKEIKTLKNLLK